MLYFLHEIPFLWSIIAVFFIKYSLYMRWGAGKELDFTSAIWSREWKNEDFLFVWSFIGIPVVSKWRMTVLGLQKHLNYTVKWFIRFFSCILDMDFVKTQFTKLTLKRSNRFPAHPSQKLFTKKPKGKIREHNILIIIFSF